MHLGADFQEGLLTQQERAETVQLLRELIQGIHALQPADVQVVIEVDERMRRDELNTQDLELLRAVAGRRR